MIFNVQNVIGVNAGNFNNLSQYLSQLRECDREYDAKHFAKTCDQVTQEEERERRQAIARGEAKKM